MARDLVLGLRFELRFPVPKTGVLPLDEPRTVSGCGLEPQSMDSESIVLPLDYPELPIPIFADCMGFYAQFCIMHFLHIAILIVTGRARDLHPRCSLYHKLPCLFLKSN